MVASITASSIVSDARQIDGRRWIQERFTDSSGTITERFYLCESAFNANTQLAQNAPTVLASLVDSEITNNINDITSNGSLATPSLVYSTVAQNLAALRAAYSGATHTQAVMIGDYLNSLTNAQLQSIFSMTAGQVTTLRANKLTPAATTAQAIRDAAGQ